MVMMNLTEYRELQKKRIARIRELKRKGPITTAKFMVLQLRLMCPKLSGDLLNSIRRKGSEVRVGKNSHPSANFPNGFPYVHWINATRGMDRIAYMKRWNGDTKKYAYTELVKGPPSGEFAFFSKAQERAKVYGVNYMVRATRNALKAEF